MVLDTNDCIAGNKKDPLDLIITQGQLEKEVEVSVVMPCLNEERTIGTCIRKAQRVLNEMGVEYEILIVDNGSIDQSATIAESLGAHVVHQPVRGYGNAYIKGISESKGKYIVMGDSDDSYDFLDIRRFIEPLRKGYEFVIGDRLGGKILPGAMPWLHRYIGNPVLSRFLNVLYKTKVSDCHCGMRSFTRSAFRKMELQSPGMEFASEMVIKASKAKLLIHQIPITLHPDGRDRSPHLRSFHDGWRHLRFMLTYSPTFMFLLPGLFFALLGVFLFVTSGLEINLFGHQASTHFSVLASMLTVMGFQIITIGIFGKLYLCVRNWEPEDRIVQWFLNKFRLEKYLLIGFAMMITAILIDLYILIEWIRNDFGELHRVKLAIAAAALFTISVQWMFSSFFIYVLKSEK